jgi:hypothetical protein
MLFPRLFVVLVAIQFCASCSSRIFMPCDSWSEPEYGMHCPSIPKVAYEVCSQKKAGDAASYPAPPNYDNHSGGEISGVCQTDYKGKLALKPVTVQSLESDGG